MRHFLFSLLMLCTVSAFSQDKGEEFFSWNAARKLTADDFKIKKGRATSSSFAQFSMGYSVKGFDFLSKNLNNRIFNHFIPSASWIDTTADASLVLTYQQTLFDLSEVYARQFRKKLKENKKKIVMGLDFVNGLSEQVMSDFTKRRLQYEEETRYATVAEKQKEWETQILKELEELKEFALK
ncbi:hypothetical protein [Pseudobacter ginsenosidimutans]|uniref:Uncharacterized protein n=1 Tax=Pseudobacter ginsenosidimutans TaxID=661488 RepID=A0A4Q7MX19_9BACT|nr:hypothetical protein [Pseudobacter ginsenosidimutans]QEC40665.1 hypothetical protein FSB84_02745 [Pseudobacter ginsenosidimutans]RZS72614.1 hypothetical protein EV199_4535 [Pseudobacter ginsenosidimutans]